MTALWGIIYLLWSLFAGEFQTIEAWNAWAVTLVIAVILDL